LLIKGSKMYRIPVVCVYYDWSFLLWVNLFYFTKSFAFYSTNFYDITCTQLILINESSQLNNIATNGCRYEGFQELRRVFPLAFNNLRLVYYVWFVLYLNFIHVISCFDVFFLHFIHQFLKIRNIFEQIDQLISLASSLALFLIVNHGSYELFKVFFIRLLENLDLHRVHSLQARSPNLFKIQVFFIFCLFLLI